MRSVTSAAALAAVSAVAIISASPVRAETLDSVVARLNALEKENALLRARLSRLETPGPSRRANAASIPADKPQVAAAPSKPEAAYASATYKALPPEHHFSWTGCYVGVQAGGSIINDSYTGRNGFGGLGGGLIGCNYQIERFVVGVEGEGWLSSISNRNRIVGTSEITTKNNWDADIALRVGLALTERILSYAKVGAVWGGFDYSTTPAGATTQGNATLSGALIGGGVEYAFSDQWTGRVEYTSNFFRGDVTFGPATTLTQSATKQTVKAAISYYFR